MLDRPGAVQAICPQSPGVGAYIQCIALISGGGISSEEQPKGNVWDLSSITESTTSHRVEVGMKHTCRQMDLEPYMPSSSAGKEPCWEGS